MSLEFASPKQLNGELKVIVIARAADQHAKAIEHQLDACIEFIRSQYEWPLSFVEVTEAGNHETVLHRVAELVADGEWDVVVAEDPTRLSRRSVEITEFIRLCKANGTKLVLVSGSLTVQGYPPNDE